MILMVAMLIGMVGGLTTSIVAGGLGFLLTCRRAIRQDVGWGFFWGAALVWLLILASIVYFSPVPSVRPGNDYEVLFKNLVLTWFGYFACPGVAVLLGFGSTLLMKRNGNDAPRSTPTSLPSALKG